MNWKDKTGTAAIISRGRQENVSLKRIILLLLSLLVVLLFSGCGKSTVQQSDSDQGDTNKAESVVTNPPTATETGPVFRSVNWGMTPEEVRAVETAYYEKSAKIDDNKVLYFKLKLFDKYFCVLAYTFNYSEQLIMATYMLKYLSNRYETYQEIMTMLKEKYGTPDEEAAYSAIWHTSRCNIALLLSSSDYKSLTIAYIGPEAAAQLKQEHQKERKKNKEAL